MALHRKTRHQYLISMKFPCTAHTSLVQEVIFVIPLANLVGLWTGLTRDMIGMSTKRKGLLESFNKVILRKGNQGRVAFNWKTIRYTDIKKVMVIKMSNKCGSYQYQQVCEGESTSIDVKQLLICTFVYTNKKHLAGLTLC